MSKYPDINRFLDTISAYGGVTFDIRSTSVEKSMSIGGTVEMKRLLEELRLGATFSVTIDKFDEPTVTDLHRYYRRWKNPWTYAIYCRDDRKVPVIELPATSPLFNR